MYRAEIFQSESILILYLDQKKYFNLCACSTGYVKTQSYSIGGMEQREAEIRTQAEQIVASKLSLHRRVIFNWILFHARRGVRHRENLRFARTKLFGVFRDLFRAIGENFVDLGLLKERQDVFYLTVEEIFAFVEGRAVTNNIPGLVELRREEFNGYRKVHERFIYYQSQTYGKPSCTMHMYMLRHTYMYMYMYTSYTNRAKSSATEVF